MSLTLTYFDFDGSRGLECRLALTVAGIPYTDERIDRPTWLARKPSTPFGALPVLSDGERALVQSNAILTGIGRGHGLHPADPWRAAEHEAVMQSVEDLRYKLPSPKDDAEKKAAREAFAAGWLAQWAGSLSTRIVGPFLEGADLHVADLKLFVILRAVRTNTYDHLPGTVLDAAPTVLALHDAVAAHPKVVAYFAK